MKMVVKESSSFNTDSDYDEENPTTPKPADTALKLKPIKTNDLDEF